MATVRKLHIGGLEARNGWEVLDVVPHPHVDHLGNAADLSRFSDATFTVVYASHVLEHFDYLKEIPAVLAEWNRVLVPKGRLYVSVPDLAILAKLFLSRESYTLDERFEVMRMMFGGHANEHDHHQTGMDEEILTRWLKKAGFAEVQRVWTIGLFDDSSSYRFKEQLISLNMMATK
jgi:predicted SAM-dependent methyltransferase